MLAIVPMIQYTRSPDVIFVLQYSSYDDSCQKKLKTDPHAAVVVLKNPVQKRADAHLLAEI